jgi:hypothetical protein
LAWPRWRNASHLQEELYRVALRNIFVTGKKVDFIALAAACEAFPVPQPYVIGENRKRIVFVIVKRTVRTFLGAVAETFSMQQRWQRQDLLRFGDCHPRRLSRSMSICAMARSSHQKTKPNGA